MKTQNISKLAGKVALISALMLAPGAAAFAQTGGTSGTGTGGSATGTGVTTTDTGYHQEGRNGYWGLLGLLGLFGLLGRNSKRDEATAYRDPADVAGTSTTTRDRY